MVLDPPPPLRKSIEKVTHSQMLPTLEHPFGRREKGVKSKETKPPIVSTPVSPAEAGGLPPLEEAPVTLPVSIIGCLHCIRVSHAASKLLI